MSSTDFTLNILAALNKQLSKKQLQGDLKSMDNSMFIKVIAKLATTLSRKQLKKDLKKLNDLYVQIGANVNVDKNTKTQLQNRIKELQKSLSELEVNLKVSKSKAVGKVDSVRREIQSKVSKVPIEFDIEVKRSKAIADIEYLGKRFSKLFTNVAAKQKYENILASAYSITDETQLKSVRNQISAFISELKACDLASQSLGDKWKNLIQRAKNLFSAASIVTTIFTQVKQAVSTFLKLDTAMTNLYKVQDQIKNRDQFSGLLTKWNKLAQNLAVTTESLINATTEWSKIGFNLDMSEQLAQITAIFEKTAEISTQKASSTLISAAQAFTEIGNLGEDDYVARVEAIGDRINAIGNKYSISSEGISDGLQNASAALKVAGNSLDETIALVTAANKIFQSPSEVSNMLKVAAARLRGQVDALEEMGEDATGVSTDITKIQQQIYELTGNKVNIFEDEDTLKSTYQMILEIGEVFDSLNDRSQADLLEVMFGKQRSSAGASLLLNYEELEKIKNDSMNAANSMAEEYSKYMESTEAHITIFKEKLVETYSTFMSGDLIKYTADVGSGILDLVNSTDLLRHGILAVLALKIGQGVTTVGAAIANTSKQMGTLGNALQQIKSLPLDNVLREKELEKMGELTKLLTEKNLNLLLSQKQLSIQDKINILSAHGLTEEEAKAKLEKMGLTTATNAQSAANVKEAATTNILKGAMGSLKASIISVGTSIKAAFMSNPIGFVLTGIVTVISVATTVISRFKQKQEEAAQALQDAVSEYESAKSSLESINSELEEQNKKMDELLSKDKLTYAEQGQLEELQAITKELQLQQDIEERRAAKASKEVASKAVDAYQKQYGKYDKTEDYLKVKLSYDPSFIVLEDKNNVLGNVAAYIRAQKLLEQMQNEYEEAVASGEDIALLDQNLQFCIDLMNDYSQAIDDNLSDLQDKRLALEDEYDKAIAKRESGLEPLASIDKEVIKTYESISDLMRMIYEYTDSNTWKSMQIENVFNTKGIEKTKEELIKMAKEGTLDESTIQSYSKLYEALKQNKVSASELCNELEALAEAEKKVNGDVTVQDVDVSLSISDTIDQLNTKLKPAFDSLKSAWQDIFTDDGFDKDAVDIPMLNSIKSSIEEINKQGINIDLSAFDEFATTLTDVNTTEEQAKQAFNDFATSIFYATGATEGITAETRELVEQLLESLGVVNASEVAEYSLAAAERELLEAKAQSIVATYDLVNASNEEYIALLEEAGAAGVAKQQIYNLAAAEIAYSTSNLSVEQKIQKLKELASAYGDTTTAALAAAIANDLASGHTDVDSALNDLMRQINSTMQKVDIEFPEIDFSGLEKKASKAGDAYVKAYEKELKELEHMHSMGLISDEEYWKARMDLNEKYFGKSSGKHQKYLKEYQDNEEKILEGIKNLWRDYYDDRKNDLKDLISYAAKLYDKEIDSLEASIEKFEERRDTEKKYWQAQIDDIDAEIDALQDANDERERAINLQQKQWALQQAMHQRTILLYSESKGFYYSRDDDAVKNAKNDLADAESDNKIANLKEQQKDLQKQLDTILETYDSQIEAIEKQIDSLKEVKSAWSDIVEDQELKELEERLKSIFGDDVKDKILNGNAEFMGSIIAQYSDTSDMLRTIEGATLADIQNMIAQCGVLPENLIPITDRINDMADGFSNVTTQVQTTKGELGESGGDGIIGKFDELNDTVSTAETTLNKVADELDNLDGMTSECTVKVNIETVGSIPQYVSKIAQRGSIDPISDKSQNKGTAHYEGTAKVTGDWSVQSNENDDLVGEEGYEIIVRDGRFFTVGDNGPEMFPIKKGDIVFNHEQSEELLKNGHTSGRGKAYADGTVGGGKFLTPGGMILAPYDPSKDDSYFAKLYTAWNTRYGNVEKNVEDINRTLSQHLVIEHNQQMNEEVNRFVNNSSSVVNNKNVQQPVNQTFNITMPNITNSTKAEELMRDLQSLNTKKLQVDWNK